MLGGERDKGACSNRPNLPRSKPIVPEGLKAVPIDPEVFKAPAGNPWPRGWSLEETPLSFDPRRAPKTVCKVPAQLARVVARAISLSGT